MKYQAALIALIACGSCKQRTASDLADFQFESGGKLNVMAVDPSDGKVKIRGCDVAKVEAAVERQAAAGQPLDMIALTFSDCDIPADNFPDLPFDIYMGLLAEQLGSKDLSQLDKDLKVAFFDLNEIMKQSNLPPAPDLPTNDNDYKNMPDFAPKASMPPQSRPRDPKAFASESEPLIDPALEQRFASAAKREVALAELIRSIREATVREDLQGLLTKTLAKIEAAHRSYIQYWEPNLKFDFIVAHLAPSKEAPRGAMITQRQSIFQVATSPFVEISKVGGIEAYTKAIGADWSALGEQKLGFLDALDVCEKSGHRLPSLQEVNALLIAARVGQGPAAGLDLADTALWVEDGISFNDDKTLLTFNQFSIRDGQLFVVNADLDQLTSANPKAKVFCVVRDRTHWTRAYVVQAMEARLAEIKAEQAAEAARLEALRRQVRLEDYCAQIQRNNERISTAQKSYSQYYQEYQQHHSQYNYWVGIVNQYVAAVNQPGDHACTCSNQWATCETCLRWARNNLYDWDPDSKERLYKSSAASVSALQKSAGELVAEFRKEFGNYPQNSAAEAFVSQSFFFRILATALCCGLVSFSAPASPDANAPLLLDSFTFASERNPGRKFTIKKSATSTSRKILDLGEDWEGRLTVEGRGPMANLRVTITHTNVLSLQDEGPHLDLFDWQSFTSPELRVEKVGSNHGEFTLNDHYFVDGAFPFITKAELLAAVEGAIKDRVDYRDKVAALARWRGVAQRCEAPQAYPCSVGVGVIRLRFYDERMTSTSPLHIIELVLPQGC